MDYISHSLRCAAEYLAEIQAARRKALIGRLIVKPEGIMIEITTAAGFASDKIVPWDGIRSATSPERYLVAAIDHTIEEAVNPKPI
jgi:hypothetical protein